MTRARRLIAPGIMTVAMLLLLLALGFWQIARLHWKEGVLARISAAEASSPVPLGPSPRPFTKVAITGTLQAAPSALFGDEVRDTPEGTRMGGQLIQKLDRADGQPILVDRGWVPSPGRLKIAQPQGPVRVTGFIRLAEKPGVFTPADDPAAHRFYTLDPAKIAKALGLGPVAPYTLVAMGPIEPGVFPQPAQHLPRPPNNHLEYALTWFGLAGVLVIVYFRWAYNTLHA